MLISLTEGLFKMITKLKFIISGIAILLMLPNNMTAQESDLGNWLIYLGSKKLNSKWNIHNEVQYRNYDVVGDLKQLLLRTGLGYNLSDQNHNLLLGYGYILSENYVQPLDEKMAVNEHRIFLSNLLQKIASVRFQSPIAIVLSNVL